MLDSYYPTVDLSFIEEQIKSCHKVQKVITIGDSSAYILNGQKPIHERIVLIRDIGNSQVPFEFATATAYKLKFMSELLAWLEENRHWKDGAYTGIKDNKQLTPDE